MLPAPAARVVRRYLDSLDRAVPGLLDGFYLVGSLALGAFRPGRSDIDFVATCSRAPSPAELASLKTVHRRSYAEGLVNAGASMSWPLVCNGVFVRRAALALPPSEVVALASQVSGRFTLAHGFDCNPITWWTLANGGVTLRGPAAEDLGVHLDHEEMRRFTASNLVSYWQPWARAVAGRGPGSWAPRLRQLHSRRLAAWGVLGTSRMHATISTGEVIAKERAGEYALETFGARWQPIIDEALSYWRDERSSSGRRPKARRLETAAFVLHVVELVGEPARSS